jgi:hypothetical protein
VEWERRRTRSVPGRESINPLYPTVFRRRASKPEQNRELFLERLFTDAPTLRRRKAELDVIEFFKAMVYERSTIALMAKFAFEVLEVLYATPVFRLN